MSSYRLGNFCACWSSLAVMFFLLGLPDAIATSIITTSQGNQIETKILHFISPLQSLTIFPKEALKDARSPREMFLSKFRSGLMAEESMREKINQERRSLDDDVSEDDIAYIGRGWENTIKAKLRSRLEKDALRLEKAFDLGAIRYESASEAREKKRRKLAEVNAKNTRSDYQFVGVIQPPTVKGRKVVKWYARKRPSDSSKWNVRLIHVNRDAIIRDLFTSGKVDIYGEYVNTGKFVQTENEEQASLPYGKPVIERKYSIRERSWRTLWNFNPIHFFTDSSGAYWRERRLSPGLYTDGKVVYESIYRYSDGKNGMKPVSNLEMFLKSKFIAKNVKTKLLKKLKTGSPDIVLEE